MEQPRSGLELDVVNPVEDLRATVSRLYPRADVRVVRGSRTRKHAGFAVAPNERNPRVLVPLAVPGAMRAIASGGSAGDSLRVAVGRALADRLLASGLLDSTFRLAILIEGDRSGSLEEYMSSAAGQRVTYTITIGSARANRKPVLWLLDSAGRSLGYAKVGLTPLAAELVVAESEALSALNGRNHGSFVTPRVLHTAVWDGLPVVVQTAVSTKRGPGSRQIPTAAMRELGSIGEESCASIGSSAWFSRVTSRAECVPGEAGYRLLEMAEAMSRRHAGVLLPFGCWHGDWGPWNMGWERAVPHVWDWERFDRDVPVGMDAVHFTSHRTLRRLGDEAAAKRVLTQVAPVAVRAVNGGDDQSACAVVDAYLLEVATRFTQDSVASPLGPLRSLAAWYRSCLSARLRL